jgi:AcrR family transcriptional regulator
MKERILQQAALLFAERGYHGVSMRELAEACEVTQAAFYYHFRSKEAILLAILQSYREEIGTAIDAIRAQNGSAAGQLTQIIEMLLSQRPDQRSVIRLAMQEIHNLDPETRLQFTRLYHERFTGQIEAVLQAGIEQHEFRAVSPAIYTWILLGMLFPFLTTRNQTPELGLAPQKMAQVIMEAFLKGVGTGESP